MKTSKEVSAGTPNADREESLARRLWDKESQLK